MKDWYSLSAPERQRVVDALGGQPGTIEFAAIPNKELTTEHDFWHWVSTGHVNKMMIYGGAKQIGEPEWVGTIQRCNWAIQQIWWLDEGELLNGGIVVLHFYSGPKADQKVTEYYKWRACKHEFRSQNIGNCLNTYTCIHCGARQTVDSSD